MSTKAGRGPYIALVLERMKGKSYVVQHPGSRLVFTQEKACTAEIEVKANSAGQGVLPCSTAVLEGVKCDWFHQKRTLERSGS